MDKKYIILGALIGISVITYVSVSTRDVTSYGDQGTLPPVSETVGENASGATIGANINQPQQQANPKTELSPKIETYLEENLQTSSEGLKEVETPDGISVDLEGRFKSIPVARIKPDGSLEITHYNMRPGETADE